MAKIKEEEEEELKLVNQAYATLHDPQSRAMYDRLKSGN
jgi:DnaJ-class molecular chaperone